MTSAAPDPIKTAEELSRASAEYQTAIRKIVRSHAVNELYGAQVFDEPAIALAPTPYAKWLTCRVAMEEYGHHVRFRELGEQIGYEMRRVDASRPWMIGGALLLIAGLVVGIALGRRLP